MTGYIVGAGLVLGFIANSAFIVGARADEQSHTLNQLKHHSSKRGDVSFHGEGN
jgi:hypothetical protein